MATSKPPPLSGAPDALQDEIDANWDDDPLVPGLDAEAGVLDRPTYTPDEPTEDLAARLMAEVEEEASPRPDPNTERGLQPADQLDPEHLSPPRLPVFQEPLGSLTPAPEPPISVPMPSTGEPVYHTEDMLEAAKPVSPKPTAISGARSQLSPDQIPTEPPDEPASEAQNAPGEPAIELDLGGEGPSALELADSQPRSEPPPAAPDSLEFALDAPRAETPPAATDADPIADMKDRYAVGDFTGALVIAESVLETEPDSHEARRYAQSCRDVLTQMYAARLGALDQIVSVAIPADQIRWLSLDHRAGFLLSLVDGISSIEEILDVSGMTPLDALRIMFTLVQQRVIALESPPRA